MKKYTDQDVVEFVSKTIVWLLRDIQYQSEDSIQKYFAHCYGGLYGVCMKTEVIGVIIDAMVEYNVIEKWRVVDSDTVEYDCLRIPGRKYSYDPHKTSGNQTWPIEEPKRP